MKNNFVSVSITYKGPKGFQLLVNCVTSLFHQTVLPKEIIIVGSKDDIQPIVKEYKNEKSKLIKLKFFMGEKNDARNLGIRESIGRFILYLDYDMIASRNLIEDCLEQSEKYKAIIIPERGISGNFWQNCRKLERKLITYDAQTVTPRFYVKSIFEPLEKPFDNRFGLLDEWGFNQKLTEKKIAVGYCKSFVVVNELDFTLWNEIKNKFRRGLWMNNFYKIDKNEAWKRINPIQRGVVFYGKRLSYLIKEPIYFPGLIVLKFVDFLAFMSGYIVGLFIKQ